MEAPRPPRGRRCVAAVAPRNRCDAVIAGISCCRFVAAARRAALWFGVMVRRAFILSALVFTGLAAGCGGDEATAFPPGLQPFEAVTVPLPAATASDPHPEVFVTRFGEGADYEWAQGRGYIHAPLARVYEALRDPEVTTCLLYTSPSPRDRTRSRMPSSA